LGGTGRQSSWEGNIPSISPCPPPSGAAPMGAQTRRIFTEFSSGGGARVGGGTRGFRHGDPEHPRRVPQLAPCRLVGKNFAGGGPTKWNWGTPTVSNGAGGADHSPLGSANYKKQNPNSSRPAGRPPKRFFKKRGGRASFRRRGARGSITGSFQSMGRGRPISARPLLIFHHFRGLGRFERIAGRGKGGDGELLLCCRNPQGRFKCSRVFGLAGMNGPGRAFSPQKNFPTPSAMGGDVRDPYGKGGGGGGDTLVIRGNQTQSGWKIGRTRSRWFGGDTVRGPRPQRRGGLCQHCRKKQHLNPGALGFRRWGGRPAKEGAIGGPFS